jgi:hypothetical protein
MLSPIVDLDDFAGNEREFGCIVPLFAPGSEPSLQACKGYAKYRFYGKNPKQSGDTATAAVTVKDRKTGSVVGEVTWKMKKIKTAWRLTDAPLPGK